MRRAVPVLVGLVLAAAFPAAASATTVAHWTFDETSGTTVADSSGFGNNGTSKNVTLGLPGFTGGLGDYAYGFDGSTSQITVPASNSLVPGAADITLSLYFRSSFHAGNGDFDWDMVKKGGYKIEIYKQKKKEQARCAFTGSKSKIDFQDGPVLTDGLWHHVVCKKTSAGVTLTVDGVTYPMRPGNVGTVKAGKELTIGWDETDFFHGTLDDLQIDIG
ncbi:MAG: LamG-like jellyroll fold domain-containing protein [Gaiellales bacterium]